MQHALSMMIAVLLVAHVPGLAVGADNSVLLSQRPVLRRPIAMVRAAEGRVLVANRNHSRIDWMSLCAWHRPYSPRSTRVATNY